MEFWRGIGRFAFDPICPGLGIHFKTQKILAFPAQIPANRNDRPEEQNAHRDRIDDSAQGETQLEPAEVQRHQPSGAKERNCHGRGRQNDQPPFRRIGVVKQWPYAQDREQRAEHKAKFPIRPELYLTEARYCFMCLHQAPVVEVPSRSGGRKPNKNLTNRGRICLTGSFPIVKKVKARVWPGRIVRARRIAYARFHGGHYSGGQTESRHKLGSP